MGGPASLVYRRGSASAASLSQLVDRRTPIDPAGLAGWALRWAPNHVGRTIYEGVRAELVPRVLDRRRAHSERRRHDMTSYESAPRFLRAAIADAVDVALAGARRVAVMTGGGLDSSVLLGLATEWARRTGGTTFAVSLDFEGRGDDRPHLRALQAHLGCEVVRVKPEAAARRISLLATGADATPVFASTIPMEVELMVTARENGAERVLAGAGGDELFGGDPIALADCALRGHPLRAARSARRLVGFGRRRAPAWSWIVRPLLARLVPSQVRVWRARRRSSAGPPAWAGPVTRSFLAEKQRLQAERPSRRHRTAAERFDALSDDNHRALIASCRQFEEHASGVDCWHPYLDLNLAEAVASLPSEYLLFGDRWRGLLRAAAHDLLPEMLRERMDKAHFEPALQAFMDAAGGVESMRPLASGRELAALGIVEPKPFAAAFERFTADPSQGECWMSLWSALAAEAFLRARAS